MTRRLLLIAAILACHAPRVRAEPAAAVLDAEAQRIAVMRKAKECVLAVFAPSGHGGGSGVVITPDGYALTISTSPSRAGLPRNAEWPTAASTTRWSWALTRRATWPC